jgi:hypothetical protein
MRTIRKHLTYTNLAATLVLVLAAGGAAWAATSSGKQIRACYKSHGGALRIAGRCKRGERALRWNQIGPPGVAGAKGVKGPTGKTGPQGLPGTAGPSDVFGGGRATGPLGTEYASFGALSVPTGSYLIEAKASFIPEGKEKEKSSMTCALAPGTALTTHWDIGEVSGEAKVGNVVSLLAAKTFAATQTIELVCKASPAGGKVENAHLVAVKTAALHGEPPVA